MEVQGLFLKMVEVEPVVCYLCQKKTRQEILYTVSYSVARNTATPEIPYNEQNY